MPPDGCQFALEAQSIKIPALSEASIPDPRQNSHKAWFRELRHKCKMVARRAMRVRLLAVAPRINAAGLYLRDHALAEAAISAGNITLRSLVY